MSVENNDSFVTQLQQLIDNGKKDASFNGKGITRNPQIAALASKLVTRPVQGRMDVSNEENAMNLVMPGVTQISRSIMGRVEDNENIFRLFPDIELAAQIIISSIVSPKDMLKTELNFRMNDTPWDPQLISQIVEVIRKEITTEYQLTDEVYDILRDALFRAGSHPKIVLPEAAVDHVINSENTLATESISNTELFLNGDLNRIQSIGILGNPHDTKTSNRTMALESLISSSPIGQENIESLFLDPELDNQEHEEFDIKAIAKLATESIKVTDNFNFLKIPDLIEKTRKDKLREKLSAKFIVGENYKRFNPATESAKNDHLDDEKKKLTGNQLRGMIYKGSGVQYKPYSSIPSSLNLRRRSVGRPLVMTVGAEAVIPVYVPGDFRKHVGYFVAVDVDGNPVSLDSTVNDQGQGINSIAQNDRVNASASSLLTERAKKNLLSDNFTPMIDQISEIYSEIVERDLLERLSKGLYSQNLEIGRNQEVYRIMLTRALKAKTTRLVYVPAEYVTYFAFDYHRNGVGRSYLDDLSNIIGMRAMVLFSSIWAKVRSSISTIKTTIHFDPKDPDPVKTIEMVKHFVARSRQQYFPNGLRRVADFTDWLQRAGIEIAWDGHPKLPSTNFEFESKNVDHVQPDDSLEETLRHMCYMRFGLSPEQVDSAATNPEFATTVQQNNILLSKRILMLGKTFGIDLTDYVRKIIASDEIIQSKIVEVLIANQELVLKSLSPEEQQLFENAEKSGNVKITQDIIRTIINNIKVSVPEPDTTGQINHASEIENYEALVDKAIKYVFDESILPSEAAGEISGMLSNLKEMWKGEMMRRFMADNNILPEAFDIFEKDEDGKITGNYNDVIEDHTKSMMAIVLDMVKRLQKAKEASDKDIQNQGMDSSGGGYDDSSSSDETNPEDNGNPFDDLGGGEDLDNIDEEGEASSEEPSSEENPEETPPEA